MYFSVLYNGAGVICVTSLNEILAEKSKELIAPI